MGLVCRASLALLLTCIVGCHRTSQLPLLAIGPLRRGDPQVLDDAMDAARAAGHPPIRTDVEHGRFAVRIHSDPSRDAVFVVQCSQDGYVTITPEGGWIEEHDGTYTMPREVRDEYASFVIELERSIPEER